MLKRITNNFGDTHSSCPNYPHLVLYDNYKTKLII